MKNVNGLPKETLLTINIRNAMGNAVTKHSTNPFHRLEFQAEMLRRTRFGWRARGIDDGNFCVVGTQKTFLHLKKKKK